MSKNGLLQHFLNCHKDQDGQQIEIENILDLAETTVADDRQKCPFCYSVGPFDKGFNNHMAFHQEQLATFAVPRNLDSDEQADSGIAEGIRSAGSLRSIALDFSDGDNSSDSENSGVSVNKVDIPLLDAAGIGNEAVVKLLLEQGAECESRDKDGQTPLALAAKNGHEAVVKLLLEHGADINAQNGEYGIALQAASFEGYAKRC